jgi:hypothetical protein
MMQARKSQAGNALFSETRSVCCFTPSSIRPISKIAMVVSWFCRPCSACIFADAGYQGVVFRKALATILPDLEIEIVRRSHQAKGFVVLPRR